MSLLDPTQLALDAAMRGSMLRQTLLTNNLANADTPGYQNEDVNFQSTLANAMQSGQSPANVNFTPVASGGANSADGNGGGGGSDSSWAREGAVLGWEGGGDGCDDLGDGDGLGHGGGRRQGGRGAGGDSHEREEEGSGDSRELHCGGLMDSIEGSVEVVRRC